MIFAIWHDYVVVRLYAEFNASSSSSELNAFLMKPFKVPNYSSNSIVLSVSFLKNYKKNLIKIESFKKRSSITQCS